MGQHIQQIADAAGVSVPTAYKAIQGTGRLAETTRKRVLAEADRLGYRPNRTAANMRRGRHGAIGLLVGQWERMPRNFFRVLIEAARRRGQFIVPEQVGDHTDMPRLLREDCIDGLILFEPVGRGIASRVRRLGLPVIEINTNRRREPGCITFDEEGGVRRVAELLGRAGCQRPAVLMPEADSSSHYSCAVRVGGLRSAAAETGLAEPIIGPAEPFWAADLAGSRTLRWLGEHPEIDAVVAYDDYCAPLLYSAASAVGRRIGRDLAVVGYNDSGYAQAVHPRLTSLKADQHAVAETAMEMFEQHAGAGTMPDPVTIPMTVIPRESCPPGMADAARERETP